MGLLFMVDKCFLMNEKARLEVEQLSVFVEMNELCDDVIDYYHKWGYDEIVFGDTDCGIRDCICKFSQLYYQRELVEELLDTFE